jgi:hypothetical protein
MQAQSPGLYDNLTKLLTPDEQGIVQSAINQATVAEQQAQATNAPNSNSH